MRSFFLSLFFIFLLITGNRNHIFAQNAAEALWPLIETELDRPDGDTIRHFILSLVRDHCGNDPDCLYQTYYRIMIKLEQRFNLQAAIFVGEEIVAIASRQKDLRREAKAHQDLDRYFSAAGFHQKAVYHIEKAIALYEQLNDQPALNYAKFVKLEESLAFVPLEIVLPQANDLLAQARKSKDTVGIQYMLIRLTGITLSAKRYDEALAYINELEPLSVSDPTHPNKYILATITVTSGRAKLAFARNDLDEARRYFEKTLRLSREKPDRWQEIYTLCFLSELEWKRGNPNAAKSCLEEAQSKAEELELHDLLSSVFRLKAQFAEEEGRYKEALHDTRQQNFHEKEFQERNAGFDLQNYYLQLEKDQLAGEAKNHELKLGQKNMQLRSSLVIMIMFLLLAAGLFIGLYNRRKGMRELARQNALIQEQSEQLKNLDAAKSRFFANVSHELRTPLTLILGPIHSLLKDTHLNEKQAKLLKMAGQSGKQLEELVAEILDLRKLEMGKMGLNFQPLPLASFFRNQFSQFESLAHRKQIDFSFDFRIEDGLAAHIDPAKCRQIVNNLLNNAFKFTPSGGWIQARLSLVENTLRLEVADSGPGIHPDDLPHVFDRFFQTSRPDTPAEGGTGIGLALCQEYARLFGGDIEVESAVGKGAVFRVWWPVELAEDVQSSVFNFQFSVSRGENADVSPVEQDSSKPTILVVEDNPELQDYIRLILSEQYNVITAGNGQEALNRKLNTENCQLILSDLMMPVMDGFQLLEKLKADDATRHIPVIMLTARADARDKLKALRIGVDDYLIKPFDEEELLARIDNLLKNQENRQEELADDTEPGEAAPSLSFPDREWLESFEDYVRKNISSDILSVPQLADEFAMSESTLLRQLKRLTGLTPNQYIQEIRLDKARQLLEDRRYKSISRVAAEVGYTDAKSFSRSFRKRFGKLPSEVTGE